MNSVTQIKKLMRQNTLSGIRFFCFFISILSVIVASSANAVTRDHAKRIYDRIAGVPPSETVLDALVADVSADSEINAAFAAMDDKHFYEVTLKNMVAPWTNESQTAFVPLNDYTATVIGMVRDNIDIRQMLYGDLLYVGDSSLNLPAYSTTGNAHYEAMDDQGVNLMDDLVATTQSAFTGLPSNATAGVMTTRAAAKEFFKDGTNRAMFRFTLLNHLCDDLEQLKDTTRSPDRIRQDVSRSPGGDSRIFLNNCVGCHSGMDPLAQAFAYYNYDYDTELDPDGENGQLAYNTAGMIDPVTETRVQEKYHINGSNFRYGYVTPDDRWDNYWRAGKNSLLGWDDSLSGSGAGAKTMGQELAHSEAFAQCQVKKVFKNVCLRSPADDADRSEIKSMVLSLKANNYNLKQVFAESAVYCKGD